MTIASALAVMRVETDAGIAAGSRKRDRPLVDRNDPHATGLSLPPVVLGHVEDDAVHVLEFLLGIDARKARQLHEELAAELLDLVGGLASSSTTKPM